MYIRVQQRNYVRFCSFAALVLTYFRWQSSVIRYLLTFSDTFEKWLCRFLSMFARSCSRFVEILRMLWSFAHHLCFRVQGRLKPFHCITVPWRISKLGSYKNTKLKIIELCQGSFNPSSIPDFGHFSLYWYLIIRPSINFSKTSYLKCLAMHILRIPIKQVKIN